MRNILGVAVHRVDTAKNNDIRTKEQTGKKYAGMIFEDFKEKQLQKERKEKEKREEEEKEKKRNSYISNIFLIF